MRGADEQEADVREFITMYRTCFTPAREESLARVIDRFCHFITALRILRQVNEYEELQEVRRHPDTASSATTPALAASNYKIYSNWQQPSHLLHPLCTFTRKMREMFLFLEAPYPPSGI